MIQYKSCALSAVIEIVIKRLISWQALLVFVAFAAIAACAPRPVGVTPRVIANQEPESITVSKTATTSVLITSEPYDRSTEIKTVHVSPGSVVVDRNDTTQLSAAAFDANGRRISAVEFVWTTVDPRVGAIGKTGWFTAGTTPGIFDDAVAVTAVQNTPSGIQYVGATASVTVIGEAAASRLTSVAVLPANPTVLSGQIYRLRAVGFDENGMVIPGVSFLWQVNAPELGHVNEIGYLTVRGEAGAYPGALTVSGVWEGVRVSRTTDVNVIKTPRDDDFLKVQVLPQSFHVETGHRLQLHAVALNGQGELVVRAEMRWSMVDSRAGTIDGSGAFFAGNTPGIYTEAIKVESIVPGNGVISRASDFASVVVKQERQMRRLESVRVMPQSLNLSGGGRALLVAQATDEFGRPAENVTVSWEATRDEVGTIDQNGSFIASKNAGTYPEALRVTVRQRLNDEIISRSKSVHVVITGTLTEIALSPTLATITPGRTVHFSATGRDENGVTLAGLVTLWKVLDPRMGKIDAFGNFTAGELPGMYQDAIRAEVIQTIPR